MRCRLATALLMVLAPIKADAESFDAFLRAFEPRAVAAGVSPAAYRAATAGLTPDPNIPALVAAQPEFTTPLWTYLDQRVTAGRVAAGRRALAARRGLFDAVAARTGVDPYVLAAIWGVETDYGAVLGKGKLIKPVVRALATLTYAKRGRVDLDAADFIAALRLAERGPRDGRTLVGSWAGAIGHLQLSAASLLIHGADGDGDTVIDPHASLADALASSANFLRASGYAPGVDWGFEVTVPESFDYLLASRETMRPARFFTERGVARVAGRRFSDPDLPVFLYAPAGRTGPKFLMTGNYLVLKAYNFSDSYALSVAHLADRLKGGGDFAASWPRATEFPNLEERKTIQQVLVRLGYYDGVVDGRLGPKTQAAYARFQAGRGEVADGFVTRAAFEILAALR